MKVVKDFKNPSVAKEEKALTDIQQRAVVQSHTAKPKSFWNIRGLFFDDLQGWDHCS